MTTRRVSVFLAAIACTALVGVLATTTPAQAGGEGCAGDVNGDGQTGVFDLLQVLQEFGPCPKKGECAGDLNGDGFVGTEDLLTVLADFGCAEDPCESQEDCDDGDPCTIDFCVAGLCVNAPLPDCK